MTRCKNCAAIKSTAAGILAAVVAGTAVCGVVKTMSERKTPKFKRSAKKALRTVEHYIDGMM